jgi:hypothetical protein
MSGRRSTAKQQQQQDMNRYAMITLQGWQIAYCDVHKRCKLLN